MTVTDPGFLVTPDTVAFYQCERRSRRRTRSLQIVKPSPGLVNWTADAVPATARQEVLAKLADGSAKVTAKGISVNGQIVAAPAWLTLTPTKGRWAQAHPGASPSALTPTQVAGRECTRAVITVVPTQAMPVQNVHVTYISERHGSPAYLPLMSK